MKIRVTEKGKKPYEREFNEKIAKIFLAKKNPNFKYELIEEKKEADISTKISDLKKKESK